MAQKAHEDNAETRRQIAKQLKSIEQQLKMNARQQGQELSDKSLHQYLMTQFKDAMSRVEVQVYTRNNTKYKHQRLARTFVRNLCHA